MKPKMILSMGGSEGRPTKDAEKIVNAIMKYEKKKALKKKMKKKK
jgi:hypothetical protein